MSYRENRELVRIECGAKKVVRTGMSVDFQGVTQIQSGDGFTVPVLGLHACGLAKSTAAGGDRLSEGRDFGSVGAERRKTWHLHRFSKEAIDR